LGACSPPANNQSSDIGDIEEADIKELPDTTVEAFFQLGVNVAGKTSPSEYTALSDGDSVPIVLGPQGAWMIVGAVHTNIFATDVVKVKVVASMADSEGSVYGKVTLKKKPLFSSIDGGKYLMNIWLVVSSKVDEETGKLVWEDKEAVFSVALEDADGIQDEDSVMVHMTRISSDTR
jgi:hypothetical protein